MNAPAAHDRDLSQVVDLAQINDHVELSRAYADRGDARRALLAMWAADVQALQALLWENGLGSAPDPEAQLAAVSQAVGASLAGCADDVDVPLTPREVAERARRAMVGTFDDSVHALLVERMAPLDHLDLVAAPLADDRHRALAQRLAGRSVEALVADLTATAGDCMAVAATMADAGDPAGATSLARQADLASFEAYLVVAAVRAGDDALVTVDLRWDLAAADDPGTSPPTGDLEQAVDELRDRLVEVVGPGEEARLRAYFEPVPFSPPRP